MKSKTLFSLFLASFLLFSCSNDDEMSSGQNSDVCVIEVACGEPEGLISVQEATQMENDYKNEFYGTLNEVMNNPHPGFEGAGRYIYFDLEEVKKYIVYVENHAAERGYNGDLGFRIYMGAKYQDNSSNGNSEPRQTVFFVPTVNPTGGTDLESNLNMTTAGRLNLGGAGIPDDMDSNVGIGN